MVTGIDLVQWQLRVARGRLAISPERALTPRGHAIECRVYAEDPDRGFLPSPGVVRALALPGGPGVRDDRGVAAGFEIPSFYDPLISKLVVWGETREAAMARLRRALGEYRVVGPRTSLPFFRWLIDQPAFLTGAFDTNYLDRLLVERRGQSFERPAARDGADAAVLAALAEWLRSRSAATGQAAGAAEAAWRRRAGRGLR